MTFLVCKTMNLHKTSSALEHRVGGSLNLCPWPCSPKWLRNIISLILFTMGLCFFCRQYCYFFFTCISRCNGCMSLSSYTVLSAFPVRVNVRCRGYLNYVLNCTSLGWCKLIAFHIYLLWGQWKEKTIKEMSDSNSTGLIWRGCTCLPLGWGS